MLFIWIKNNFSISYIPLIYSLLQKTTIKKENQFFIRNGKKIQQIQMMLFIMDYDINQKQKKRYGLRG
ncbi:BA71V-C84L [African swine fever virus]|nr:BA71V-C84L [African swine fever virus]